LSIADVTLVAPIAVAQDPAAVEISPLNAGAWLQDHDPEMSENAGCEACGTPEVEIESSHLLAVDAKDCTPPSVDADGFGKRAAGNVPVVRSAALPDVATATTGAPSR
jgi:hypothetical protein